MKDHVHRSHKRPGGHVPYVKPQPHQQPVEVVSGAEIAATTQFEAVATLNKKIGGKWSWDATTHTLSATFDTQIAKAIQTYLLPICSGCEYTSLTAEQAQLSLTVSQYSPLKGHKFDPREVPLAKYFAELLRQADRSI